MKKNGIVALAMAATFTLVAAPAAQADNSRAGQVAQPESRATALTESASDSRFSDRDVAKLLLLGEGPMATPELVNLLGFDPNRPKADPAEVEKLLDLYLASVPNFHGKVTVPFQSGKPMKVDSALRTLSSTYNEFLRVNAAVPETGENPEFSAQGWAWMGANVLIYANAIGVANAVGYTNVGVATFALATLGFVTWYLPDYGSDSGIDREARVAELADAVAE